jgi:hypothetical protein
MEQNWVLMKSVPRTELPNLILLRADALASVRRRLFAGDPMLMAADNRLIQEANQALGLAPRSVLDKVEAAPSGSHKDYASIT